MININLIDFKRVIMHEVHRKTNQNDAIAECTDSLINLNEDVTKTIKERLSIAFGKRTRCFEMSLSKIDENSFFGLCKDLKKLSDEDFIAHSKNIASLLAQSQNKQRIPGGYFILIEGTTKSNHESVYIAIKADLQEALSKNAVTGAITVLKEVFLSPAQKLYKVGLLIEKQVKQESIDPNDDFTCFLFDEQFNTSDAIPATYFFDDFLGFTESKNAKITTKRFYDQVVDFFNENYPDMDERIRLIGNVKTALVDTVQPIFDPTEFGRTYIKDTDIKNRYAATILAQYSTSFTKDITLLESTFKKSNLWFPNKIKISGPSDGFDEYVSVVDNQDDLSMYMSKDSDYTILVVKGRPQRNV